MITIFSLAGFAVLLSAACSQGAPSIEDLTERADASEEIMAAVTYDVTYDAPLGAKGQATVVQKNARTRWDAVGKIGGESVNGSQINTESVSYICFPQPGESEGTCVEGSGGPESELIQSFVSPFLGWRTYLANEPEGLQLLDVSACRIAGLDAECFSVIAREASGQEFELCFSEDDILLYFEIGSGGTNRVMEATSVSTEVSDEDFLPPFPVTERPPQL